MTKIADYLGRVDFEDKRFIGTITFRSEEISLPDGSKMALGIDGGHWVLVYQKGAGTPFTHFECDFSDKKILLDNKPGGAEEFKRFRDLINYFFTHAQVDDLVTLMPPGA